jgi:para-nitrobenzyl esterase
VIALSGGISSAASLPPGSIPVVLPPAVLAARAEGLLAHSLIADATASGETSAKAYIGTRSAQQVADYLRGKSADALLTTVRTRLAPLGLAAANPIPDGTVVAADPIASIRAGRYVKVPVMAGNTRDETKLFPTLLALRPTLGGASGRLIDDAAVFAIAHGYDPEAPPATRIEDWIPARYLPVDAPETGFDARTRELDRIWFQALRDDLLDALKSRQPGVWHYRFDWDELPQPFDVIYGAAHAFDLPFVFGNFGPSLYANISFTRANRPGRLALSHAMMKSVGAFARSGDPNDAALGATWKPWPSRILFDASPQTARISTECECAASVSDRAREPAVDADVLAGDVGGPFRSQEGNGRRDLLAPAVPLHRDGVAARVALGQAVDPPGQDVVHADVFPGVRIREDLGE